MYEHEGTNSGVPMSRPYRMRLSQASSPTSELYRTVEVRALNWIDAVQRINTEHRKPTERPLKLYEWWYSTERWVLLQTWP